MQHAALNTIILTRVTLDTGVTSPDRPGQVAFDTKHPPSPRKDSGQMMYTEKKRPIPDSYWVDKGVVGLSAMGAGSILAGEYPGAREQGEAERKLLALLSAGVSSFLDLTEEGEYGLVPYSPQLRTLSTGAIQHHRMAIPDLSAPSAEQMEEILDFLDQATRAGHTVYVHCFGGIGRTGTVIGCYLARHGLTGDQAIKHIAEWRAGTPDGNRWSPETVAQRQMVRSWPTRA